MKTKIILLSTALLFMVSVSSFAQSDDKDVYKGIRAGWQSSNLFLDGSTDGSTNLSSFYVGIFGEKKLIPLLSFGASLEYSQVGSVASDVDDTKFVMHYVGVPLYVKVKLGPVFALGGAAANFKVAESFTLLGEKLNDEDYEALEIEKSNVFDVPLFLGLGVKILMINIEARYYWGMLDIDKSDAFTLKSQYFQIGAGISF